jgi:hypothetical protein
MNFFFFFFFGERGVGGGEYMMLLGIYWFVVEDSSREAKLVVKFAKITVFLLKLVFFYSYLKHPLNRPLDTKWIGRA